MTIRSILLAALAVLVLGAQTPAQARDTTSGQWTGWVQWSGETPINASWTLNDNDAMSTNAAPQEYGYWVEVGEYVEMLYPCTNSTFICHFRGRRFGDRITGTATTNEGHSATFQMER
jgi:hypothetical protein